MDKLAVIILNYNSYEDTLNLINSIEKFDPGICVIVVDNASDSKERQKILDIKNRCLLILLDENGGYASGNNAGIRKAIELGYETFLLANSDTYLISENAISNCYAYMKEYGIGILGPRMINESGEDISGYIQVDKYGRTQHHLTNDITKCKSLVGAFILIDKYVIDKIGYMREFYFLYREETDYCVRAYNEDVKIVYYPMVTVVHKSGATTKDVAHYYYHRNMFIFAREIYGISSFRLAVFYFLRYVLTSTRILFKNEKQKEKIKTLKQIWLAYFDGVRDIRGKRDIN